MKGMHILLVKKLLIVIFSVTILLFGSSCSKSQPINTYSERLYTPTEITKIKDTFFIVDCWNHRIIYSKFLDVDISKWNVLDSDIAGPHSIASDGEVYLAEDTGRHREVVYKIINGEFVRTQIIDNMGSRPHRTLYDLDKKVFYVLSSMTQELIVLYNENGNIKVKEKIKLPFLEGAYTRSASLIDKKLYFVSGPGRITIAEYETGKVKVNEQFDVPPEYSGMNDIIKIRDYFYITATPQKIIRLKDLSNFNASVDLMGKLQFKGTPYFISVIDDKIYVPEITEFSGIKSFQLINDKIMNIETINSSGEENEKVKTRKSELPT